MSILIISFWSNLAPRSEVRANSSRIVFNVAKDWAATFTCPMICQDMSRRRQLETVSRTVSITLPIWSIWSICNTPMIFLRIFYHIYAILCTSLHVSHLACLSSSFPNLSQPSTTFPTGSTWFNVPQRSPMVHMVPPRPTCRRSQPGLHLEFNVSRCLFSLRPTPRWRFNGGQEITGRRKQSFKLWNHSVIGEEFISNKDQIRSS